MWSKKICNGLSVLAYTKIIWYGKKQSEIDKIMEIIMGFIVIYWFIISLVKIKKKNKLFRGLIKNIIKKYIDLQSKKKTKVMIYSRKTIM